MRTFRADTRSMVLAAFAIILAVVMGSVAVREISSPIGGVAADRVDWQKMSTEGARRSYGHSIR